MKLWPAVCGTVAMLALVQSGSALAQEDPEAVYARLHRATLAGKSDEVLGFGTARQRADLASKSKGEKDAVIGLLGKMMPKSYTVTGKSIAPDGNSAALQATGVGGLFGNSQMYLVADFAREGGAWKVDKWAWSSDKPAALAAAGAKPAAKVAEPGPAPAAMPVTPVATATAKVPVTQSEAKAPLPAARSNKPSRANEDARACLGLATDAEIIKCAEKFL